MNGDDRSLERLREALAGLASRLEGFTFWLPGPSHGHQEKERAELIRSIRAYVLPRLADPSAPVVAVVAGPTGSGKSTLFNTLAGAGHSEIGALRPTTTAPVVWAGRSSAARYRDFLPGIRGRLDGGVKVVESDDPLAVSLTLVDAPDFESVYPDVRAAGDEVLAAADLCVFVASALRYADAAAWSFLDQVRLRGLPILFVLNRLPDDIADREALLADFAAMLVKRDLLLTADPSLIFGILEQRVSPDGMLDPQAAAAVRRELSLIADPTLRTQVLRQSTEGAVAEVIERAEGMAAMVDADRARVDKLRTSARAAYTQEGRETDRLIRSGGLVDVDERAPLEDTLREVGASVTRRVGSAARQAAAAWEADPYGAELLEADRSLWSPGPDVGSEAQRAVGGWGMELANLMTLRAGRTRRRRSTRQRLSGSLAAATLGPSGERAQLLGRKLDPALVDELIEHGADDLSQAGLSVLEADEARFMETADAVDLPADLSDGIRAGAGEVSEAAGAFYGE